MISSLRFIFALLIMVLLVTFAVKNNTPTTLYYYFGYKSPEIPLFLVILMGVVIGAVFVWFVTLFEKMKLKYTIRQKEKKIREVEKELADLKNLPIEEPLSSETETGAPHDEAGDTGDREN